MISELLDSIRMAKIKLWVEKDQLRYASPPGALTPELRRKIIEYKTEIIQFLQEAATLKNSFANTLEFISRDQPIPLSEDQQRLWLMTQLAGEQLTHNTSIALFLDGKCEHLVLERALKIIIERHESLRTSFHEEQGKLIQKTHFISDLTINLPIVDVQKFSDQQRQEMIQNISNEEANYLFDLTQAPLIRTLLLKCHSDAHILLVTIHHIVFDAWSLDILIRELATVYQSLSENSTLSLPNLTYQFADFVGWQAKRRQQIKIKNQLDFWKQKLGHEVEKLELPTDYPKPLKEDFKGSILTFKYDEKLLNEFQQVSQNSQTTLFTFLLANFLLLIHYYSEQNDIIIGIPVANRNQKEFENLIGFFAYPLPLRIQLSPNWTFRKFLAVVTQEVLNINSHQDVPLTEIVNLIPHQTYLNENPLFQILFTFLGKSLDAVTLSQLTINPQFLATSYLTDMDLNLIFYEKNNKLNGLLIYKESRFKKDSLQLLFQAYSELLKQSAHNLETVLSEFTLPIAFKERMVQIKSKNRTKKLVVAASFTAEPIEVTLSYWMSKLNVPVHIEFAPYNQIFQELLNPYSIINQNDAGVNLMLLRCEDWVRFDQDSQTNFDRWQEKIKQVSQEFVTILQATFSKLKIPLILVLCPHSSSLLVEQQQVLAQTETWIVSQIKSISNLHLILFSEIQEIYEVEDYYDADRDELGHIPYNDTYYAILSTVIARKLYDLNLLYSCVMVSNTEWADVGNILASVTTQKQRSQLEQLREYNAPRNEIEQQIAIIWQEVLKMDRVGINDNFFEVGGNSLLATQVVSRMRHTFAIDMALRSLFDYPILSQMAEQIQCTRSLIERLKPAEDLSSEQLEHLEEFEL